MNLSKRGVVIGIIVLLVAAGAALWGISSAERDEAEAPAANEDQEDMVEEISFDEESIKDQDGNTLVARDDVPTSLQVSEESEFGVDGPITSAVLSDDSEWIAFSGNGVAHAAGYLYEIESEEVLPVAFQYGGGVEAIEWSPDSEFTAFMIGSPAGTELIKVVDKDETDGYVSEIGHQIKTAAQEGMNPPFAYEFEGWEAPHTLCYSFEGGDEECVDAEELTSAASESE